MPFRKQSDDKKDVKKRSSTAKPRTSKRFIQQISPPAIIQRAKFDPSILSPEEVLKLQGTVGNRATQ